MENFGNYKYGKQMFALGMCSFSPCLRWSKSEQALV